MGGVSEQLFKKNLSNFRPIENGTKKYTGRFKRYYRLRKSHLSENHWIIRPRERWRWKPIAQHLIINFRTGTTRCTFASTWTWRRLSSWASFPSWPSPSSTWGSTTDSSSPGAGTPGTTTTARRWGMFALGPYSQAFVCLQGKKFRTISHTNNTGTNNVRTLEGA